MSWPYGCKTLDAVGKTSVEEENRVEATRITWAMINHC
jgi:hypothetical protein